MRQTRELLDTLYDMTGKDMGDFGGWDGLKDYCVEWYGDGDDEGDLDVMLMVAFIDARMREERQDA